ncbi:MAG: hypothetical protein E7378_03610 [Clostridiales bacterium]|nr:hypothetical protein [Clostridiales bacterium]
MAKKVLAFLFVLSLSTLIVGCSSKGKKDYDMSQVTFNDVVVEYDGNAHYIQISGELPQGVSVTYSGNYQTEVGTYVVTASFSGNYEKYNEIVDMTATLTITKKQIPTSSIVFNDKTVTYNGNQQFIYVSGVPSGIEVNYTNNGKTNAGTYEVTASFTDTTGHYQQIPDMTATLTINKQQIGESSIVFSNKTVTFDGSEHYIYATGLPTGIQVEYTNNGKTNAGTYDVIAQFTDTTGNYDVLAQKPQN